MSASTTRKRKPGVMKMSVSPLAWPLAAQLSSVRTLVVPTATTRPPRARQSAIACAVSGGTW